MSDRQFSSSHVAARQTEVRTWRRLSEILSVLGRLMAPLVAALSGNEALVTLSIRTLEYWVDSLNPEFLEPAMLPVIPQLMRALWSHLRPLPYNFSAKVPLCSVPTGCFFPF